MKLNYKTYSKVQKQCPSCGRIFSARKGAHKFCQVKCQKSYNGKAKHNVCSLTVSEEESWDMLQKARKRAGFIPKVDLDGVDTVQ